VVRSDPEILGGTPVFAGTRVPIKNLLDYLACKTSRPSVLTTSHFCWLPRQDRIARVSEELVLRYNPKWTGADWAGQIPLMPKWAEGHFELRGMFVFDEPIAFTRESWRGRIRACRGVGATMPDEQVERYDREHDSLPRAITTDDFSVLHRVDAHVLRPMNAGTQPAR
jgi:hypothetical protein